MRQDAPSSTDRRRAVPSPLVNKRILESKWSLLIPITLGLGGFFVLKLFKPAAGQAPPEEVAQALRVLRAERSTVIPRVSGYGIAEPAQTWRAVARVEGRVVEVRDELRAGTTLAAGETLLRIDPAPYELAVARANADLAKSRAEQEQLDVEEANDEASLAIEEETLRLAEADLARFQELFDAGDVSQSELDSITSTLLSQKQVVQNLKGGLQLLPSRRATLEATIKAQAAALAEAELDLGYTTLTSPIDGLVGDVSVDVGQFLSRGEAICEVLGVQRAEIAAEFLYNEARRLLGPDVLARLTATSSLEPEPELRALFTVAVRVQLGEQRSEWQGTLLGTRESVDSATRALGITVGVEDPVRGAIPGERPALLRGTFCEVEVAGQARDDLIVLPREAVRGEMAFVLDADLRLVRVPVEVAFAQGPFVAVADGLEEGTYVVVGDPGAAVEGMLVEPVEDADLSVRLRTTARGGDVEEGGGR